MVVIVGTTGAGKSKLAVDVALKFNGEIVSADSMQVYDGLPIATNHITAEEMRGVPHHLVGGTPPDSAFSIGDFLGKALPTIEDILSRGCLPIVVGGTHYYIDALLFERPVSAASSKGHSSAFKVEDPPSYARLVEADPEMAQKLHPNDHRKIARSLEVFATTGQKHSTIIADNALSEGRLRYPMSCCLWVLSRYEWW